VRPPEGETTFVYRLEDSDRASVFSQEPEIVVEHGRSTKTEQSAVRRRFKGVPLFVQMLPR